MVEAVAPDTADAGECGFDLFADNEFPVITSATEFCDTADDDEDVAEPVDDVDEFDDDELPLPSCDDAVPLISFDLTISCLASLVLVPGLVRLIFILRPLSTVAECSTAILPGLPVFVCTAFTAPDCCLPVGPLAVFELLTLAQLFELPFELLEFIEFN